MAGLLTEYIGAEKGLVFLAGRRDSCSYQQVTPALTAVLLKVLAEEENNIANLFLAWGWL